MVNRLEGQDIFLAKAKFEDWPVIWHNVWSRPQTARYMLWQVTTDESAAQDRMRRTIEWQKDHDAWLVYEKSTGQAIGFAGVVCGEGDTWEDTGIALGPAYVGRGYGKQVVRCLLNWCAAQGGKRFCYTTRTANAPSVALALACGFAYDHTEPRTDERSGEGYEVAFYYKDLHF